MTSGTARFRVPQTWFWTVACFGAMAAMMADANLDLLDEPWRSLLKLAVLALAAGTLVASHRQAEAEGPLSPAYETLGMRVMATVVLCIAVFSAGAAIYHRVPLGTPALWLLGLSTAIPVLALIWAMGRYLAEETDEYLRHLAIMSALIGLAVTLVLASVWGFLESLGLVAHVPSWYAVPLFCLANGVGRAWLKARNR